MTVIAIEDPHYQSYIERQLETARRERHPAIIRTGTIYQHQETSFVLVVPATTDVHEVKFMAEELIREGEELSSSVGSIWDAYVVKAPYAAALDHALGYCLHLLRENPERRVFFWVKGAATPTLVRVQPGQKANDVLRACSEAIKTTTRKGEPR